MSAEITSKMVKFLSPTTGETPLFPDEIILEILLRLPVKSLLKFRCVCKSWKTLISNPKFVRDHLGGTSTNMTHQRLLTPMVTEPFQMASCCIQSMYQNPSTPAIPTCFTMSDEFCILGSCNGLICMFNYRLRCIQLWNPSTRIVSKTYPTGFTSPREHVTYRGFGYDHINNEYKLYVTANHNKMVTKLYNFGASSEDSKCWKVIPNFPCCPAKSQGQFLSGTGTINWFCKTEGAHKWVIISFDLVTETYGGEVLLPDGETDNICIPELVVLRNCLCVSLFDTKKDQWVLWQMKEYGVQDSWTKLMMVPHFIQGVCTWDKLTLSPHHEHDPSLRWFHSVIPLCISEDGVILIKTAFSKLVLYNPNDGSWDFPVIKDHHWHNIHTYHESMVSPLF